MSGLKSMFKCELCNIEMTGQENYQQHIEGKKHLKKIKSLGLSSGASHQGSQEGKECENLVKVNQSSNGIPHSSNLKANIPPPQKQVTAGEILGTTNEDPVMNAITANMLGKLPLKRMAYDRRCDVCGVDYTSRTHEEQHIIGKKHLKKVQAKEGNDSINSATLYCGFCNLRLNSVEQMDQHRSGASHKKKVEKAQIDQLEHSAAKKKFVPSSGSEISDSQLLPPPDTTLPVLQPLTYDK